jgi:site-specific recombinase XerD
MRPAVLSGHKEVPVTRLHQMMLEELQRRNYAQNTVKSYIRIVRDFAKHYNTAPDLLGPDQIREYSAYLFQDRKLDAGTVEQHVAGLRFFYVKTLKRHFMVDSLPFPKRHRKLPEILSPEEMAQLIDYPRSALGRKHGEDSELHWVAEAGPRERHAGYELPLP